MLLAIICFVSYFIFTNVRQSNLVPPPHSNLQNIVSSVPTVAATGQHQPQISQPNLLSTAIMLRERHGMGIFVRGMTPKMLQAGLNHAVTFYVYDLILGIFSV